MRHKILTRDPTQNPDLKPSLSLKKHIIKKNNETSFARTNFFIVIRKAFAVLTVRSLWSAIQSKFNNFRETTGLPSSVCVVCYAFIMAVSVYQARKIEGEI